MRWQASQATTFDLHTNRLRPERWTSSDAAGLPILPSIVRYDEVARGDVNHALRVTVQRTRREYVYPARHFASTHTDPSLPRMGERLRLRSDFDITGCSWRTTAATGCCRSRRTVESQGSIRCRGSKGRTSKWSSRPDPTRGPEHERANDEPAGDGLVSRAGGCLCGAIEYALNS